MRQVVIDLHRALHKSGVKPPYVLVGHSLGGLFVREFALRYPTEVVGLVLVDASHEDMLITMTNRTTKRDTTVRWRELSRGRVIPPVQMSIKAGKKHLSQESPFDSISSPDLEPPFTKLPLIAQRWRMWATKSGDSYQNVRFSEFDFFPEELALIYAERKKTIHPLSDIPMIVLTAGRSEDLGADSTLLREDHERCQVDLATLSTNSRRIVARNSGHHIQLDEPELVIDAIGQVLDAVREHKRLE